MRKKLLLFLVLISIIIIVAFIFAKKYSQNKSLSVVDNSIQNSKTNDLPSVSTNPMISNKYGFQDSLDRANERITKKPFGIYITPSTSPVQPEKFSGYHTGTDFEIFPEELDKDVSVKAVCSGKLIVKEYANGYGGVVVEACNLDGQDITVVYGHLKLASISLSAGADLKAEDAIGILGKAYSAETNGERKHLHLGFHKGKAVNILGYVNSETSLSDWLDPCQYICGK